MTAPTPIHVPVLLNESLRLLDVREGGVYIDCTTGLGGHSSVIAERMGDTGRLLCLDQDREALEFARAKLAPFGRRVRFVHANFRELAEVAKREGFQGVDGILMDLGISSFQIGEGRRGFAFALEGPLDMRMDPSSGGITAEEIVNTWDETSLADLFFELGEERQSRRIARAIVRSRPAPPGPNSGWISAAWPSTEPLPSNTTQSRAMGVWQEAKARMRSSFMGWMQARGPR